VTKSIRFPVGVLNISMEAPHSPERYVQLLETIHSLRRIVSARGTTGAIIGSLWPINKNSPEDGLSGEFYTFIQLNPGESWFDIEKKDEASADDRKEINIPDKLKPHLARFPFVFFPKGHRLYLRLETEKKRKFGVKAAQAVIRRLLVSKEIAKFGKIEVTVEPDKNVLQEIFEIRELNSLKIELVRPNPDDHGSMEKRLLDRLNAQNSAKMTVTLSAAGSDGLKPDEEMKGLAQVAASNGYVHGRGRNAAGQIINMSTRNDPWIEYFDHDANIQTEEMSLQDAAARMERSRLS